MSSSLDEVLSKLSQIAKDRHESKLKKDRAFQNMADAGYKDELVCLASAFIDAHMEAALTSMAHCLVSVERCNHIPSAVLGLSTITFLRDGVRWLYAMIEASGVDPNDLGLQPSSTQFIRKLDEAGETFQRAIESAKVNVAA